MSEDFQTNTLGADNKICKEQRDGIASEYASVTVWTVAVILQKRQTQYLEPALMVRITRFELARPFGHKNLNLTRLPIPPYSINMEKYYVISHLYKYDFLIYDY